MDITFLVIMGMLVIIYLLWSIKSKIETISEQINIKL